MNDVTRILSQIASGDELATNQLLPAVYEALRRLAVGKINQEAPGQTLQPTALVHEAYLRVLGSHEGNAWNHRGHFFVAAAEAMRRILIEQARRKNTLKRGGGQNRIEFDEANLATSKADIELLALDEALEAFERKYPKKAELVKLRYFAGLTIPQAAEILKISTSTADNYWAYARSWLRIKLRSAETV